MQAAISELVSPEGVARVFARAALPERVVCRHADGYARRGEVWRWSEDLDGYVPEARLTQEILVAGAVAARWGGAWGPSPAVAEQMRLAYA